MEHIQYLTIRQVAESNNYPFTIGQIRHFLSLRHRNGLEAAVRKIGKRLYLRKDILDCWIDQQRGGN